MDRKCTACKDGVEQPMPFSMAFQPIVDVETATVFAYEALVRGPNGESAYSVLSQVTEQNRYGFDQNCRVKAITLACKLGLPQTGSYLSINFMPGAVYSPSACSQLTRKTAREMQIPLARLIFEITEGEEVNDPEHLHRIAEEYRKHGLQVALDDFGAGYSGMNLLASLATDVLKLDMALTRDLPQRPTAQRIVRSMAELCKDLNIRLIAEGIETKDEFDALRDCGIHLMQGYLLARPAFEALPDFELPQALPFHHDDPKPKSTRSLPWFPLLHTIDAI